MNPWKANVAILQRRFPEVARRVLAAQAGPPRWRAKEDSHVLAECWVEDLSWQDGVFIAVSGVEDGRHLASLMARLPHSASIFVAEAEPGVFRAALEAFDLSGILDDARLMLAVGEVNEAFFSPLQRLDVLGIRDVQTLVFSPAYNRDPSFYARAFTEVARQIDFRRKLYGTAVADAELWQSNTFANLETVATAPDVGALRNVCMALPMVIVSAGPSLDESIEFLKEVSGHAVVVAVNSSYRAVRHAGIVPHFVMAADPREFVTRGFEGVPVDGTWLVTTPIVNPGVARLFSRAVYSWSGSNELVTEIRRRCGLPPGTALVEQGTVSACAVDLAVVLGCDRVCLVGQDMAVREDGRSHATDSFYSDLNRNRVDPDRCRRLPGNTVDLVPVEEKLYVYLKTFEQLVAARPGLSFVNTAMYGARIAGVPYAGFREARQWLGGESSERVGRAIAEVHGRVAGQALRVEAIRAVLKPTRTYAREILREALALATRAEALPERVYSDNGRNSPEVRELFRRVEQLERDLKSRPREYGILEAGRTRMELFRCREFEAGIGAVTGHAKRIDAAREFAWAVTEGAWFLNRCLSRFVPEEKPA